MSAPQIGEVLAGKYRVEKVLGVGGMGMVVAALHLELDQLVALKFMRDEVLSNQGGVDRFLREARAAVRLKNEHICRVMDVGRLPNQAPYIVLEYLEGHDLSTELEQRGPLPPGEVVELLLQACEGMAEAHALGIIHRDLKPQNLFLGRRPDGTPLVKVLDFGVAKTQMLDAVSTRAGSTMGSPAYLSPEQWRSAKDVDARTDIYALGVILFQLLTGRLPIEAEAMPELCVKVMEDRPPSLRSFRPGLPAGLEAVVQRCLAKTPDERYENVVELCAALMPFAPMRSRDALSLISKALHVPEPTVGTVAAGTREVTPPNLSMAVPTTLGESAGQFRAPPLDHRGRRRWILGGVSVLGLAAIVLVTQRGNNDQLAARPSPAALQVEAGVAETEAGPAPLVDASVASGIDAEAAVDAAAAKPDANKNKPRRDPPKDAGAGSTVYGRTIVDAAPSPPPDATIPTKPKCDPEKDPSCLFKTNQ